MHFNEITHETLLPVFEAWAPIMAVASFNGETWSEVELRSVGPFEVHPAAMAVQFGASVFEGAKARRCENDTAHLFRPDDNYRRFCKSAERLCLPYPPQTLYDKAMQALVGIDGNWQYPFSSEWLYIRPQLFALDNHLMPVAAHNVLFTILVAPIRSFNPQRLTLSVERVQHRATPGGLGAVKTAANYAHQFHASQRARALGYDAVLWLSPLDNCTIEEASTMNVFFALDGKIITPKLNDTVLSGITRRSVIEMLMAENYPVEERIIMLDEIREAVSNGHLSEMFLTSTALGIRAVDTLIIGNERLMIAKNTHWSTRLANKLQEIYRGKVDSVSHKWLRRVEIGRRLP